MEYDTVFTFDEFRLARSLAIAGPQNTSEARQHKKKTPIFICPPFYLNGDGPSSASCVSSKTQTIFNPESRTWNKFFPCKQNSPLPSCSKQEANNKNTYIIKNNSNDKNSARDTQKKTLSQRLGDLSQRVRPDGRRQHGVVLHRRASVRRDAP